MSALIALLLTIVLSLSGSAPRPIVLVDGHKAFPGRGAASER